LAKFYHEDHTDGKNKLSRMSPSLLLVRYIDTKFHQNYSQTVRVYLGERVNSVVRPPQPTAMFEAAESY